MTSAKIIILVVSIVMPQNQPDVNHIQRMKDFASCWGAAQEFVERDLTEELRSHGAIGFRAACQSIELPSEKN